VLARLGGQWQVLASAVKPHACCRYNHAAIDAVLAIVGRVRLAPGDVAGVTTWVPPSSLPIVAEPSAAKAAPRNVVDAQFSLPYAVAVAIRHGRASLAEYTEAALADPDVRRLAAAVTCAGDEALDRAFPGHWGARVELRTVDGARHEAVVPDAKGSPRNPLTWDELTAKARALTDGILSPARLAALLAATARLEELPDIAALLEPLT
jgi:2-methylcitrate dehydratase PrpD